MLQVAACSWDEWSPWDEMCTCKTSPHVSQCILEVWVWTDSFPMYALWCVEYTQQHLLPITDKDESAHFSLLRIWNFSESFCVEDTVQVFCVPFVPGPAFCLAPRPICVVSTVFYQRIILSVSNQPKYPTPAPSDFRLVGPRSPTVCPKSHFSRDFVVSPVSRHVPYSKVS